MKLEEQKLRKINKVLSVIVLLLGLYIISIPFIPELELFLNQSQDSTAGFVYKSNLSEDKVENEAELKPIPTGKHLVIPKINVDEEILEGSNINILNNGGTWRRPNTSDPTLGGNTVIVGHRFGYNGDRTFYHLNKLLPGDEFIIFWDKVEYDYRISEIREVTADQIQIENQTEQDQVTLYTCAGLSAENRFVVIAELVDTINHNEKNEGDS